MKNRCSIPIIASPFLVARKTGIILCNDLRLLHSHVIVSYLALSCSEKIPHVVLSATLTLFLGLVVLNLNTDYSQTVVVLQGLILLVLSSTCSTILVFFMNFPSPAISNNHRVKVDGCRFSLPFDLCKIFLKLQSLWWYSHPPPPQSLPHPLLT